MYRDTDCRLQAHRGVSTDAPENTMAAFKEAVAQGYDLIEFDPKFTKDNICVVLHDRTLNRTARIAGMELSEEKAEIREKTFAELSDIDVGFWFDKKFTGEHIPTLAQVLDYMKSTGIEGKIDNVVQSFTDEQIEIMFDIIGRHGGKVGLTCSEIDLLERFAKRFPSAPLHYDGIADKEVLDRLAVFAQSHEITVWARLDTTLTNWCKVPPANAELSQMIHNYGFKLGIWILVDDNEMTQALDLGADIVETTGGIKP